MKSLFKHSKAKTPVDLVKHVRDLLIYVHRNSTRRKCERKCEESKISDLRKSILEMRTVLFGDGESEPSENACKRLTEEFFREDTLRLLIGCLGRLDSGLQLDAIQVVTNLLRQRVVSNPQMVSKYMENNLDLMDILISGYEEDDDIALSYGVIARDCIRHQSVAKYVLESQHMMKKFFKYLQNPSFEISSDAQATFKELLTRHKATVTEFLSTNYDWFFQEYNSKLLESTNYITRRQAVRLLGDILEVVLCGSNSAVRDRYVGSLDNMKVVMNLLKDANKHIQLESFNVFKLFVANQRKPREIVRILQANRSKLLEFLGDFYIDRVDDDQFEADKRNVMLQIITVN